MPRWTVVATPAVFVLLVAVSAAPASEFTDFRIPPSSWRQYSVSLGGNAQRATRVEPGAARRDGALSGRMSTRFSLGADSDPRQWDVGFSLAGDGQRGSSVTDQYSQVPDRGPATASSSDRSRRRDRMLREGWTLTAGGRLYPFEKPFGLEVRGSLRGMDFQTWHRASQHIEVLSAGTLMVTDDLQSTERWDYRETADLQASAGFGRVRDATPVFQVLLLEERLTRDHVLARPLSAAARKKLAELFSLQGDFGTVHEQPAKFFWREVERLLAEDGALDAGGLTAFDVHHVEEALPVARAGFRRQVGWFVGPVVSGVHQHFLTRSELRTSNRVVQDGVLQSEIATTSGDHLTFASAQLLWGGQAELHRPLGPRTQLDLFEQALVSRKGEDDFFSVSGDFRLQHLIAERWLAELFADHGRQIQSINGYSSTWAAAAGGDLVYFLEDHCRLDLLLQQQWSRRAYGGLAPDFERAESFQASVAVTVGRGRLTAPGLLAPVLPLN